MRRICTTRDRLSSLPVRQLSVSLFAVLDLRDLDGVRACVIEKHPVASAAEPEARQWRSEGLHAADTFRNVIVDALKLSLIHI